MTNESILLQEAKNERDSFARLIARDVVNGLEPYPAFVQGFARADREVENLILDFLFP